MILNLPSFAQGHFKCKQDLKKSVTASIWLFCHFFKLPFFTSFSLLPFHSFFYFFFFQILLNFPSLMYFTFKVLLYFPSFTLFSSHFQDFFPFLIQSDLTRPNPIWFCFFNPSFFSFLVRFIQCSRDLGFICICCCFPFTGCW